MFPLKKGKVHQLAMSSRIVIKVWPIKKKVMFSLYKVMGRWMGKIVSFSSYFGPTQKGIFPILHYLNNNWPNTNKNLFFITGGQFYNEKIRELHR